MKLFLVLTTTFIITVTSQLSYSQSSSSTPLDVWTTQDVIDQRIDTHAQNTLMHMFSGTQEESTIASAILSAVKDTNELQGVYLNSRGIPAQQAQSTGIGWWDIIPKSEQAICWKPAASDLPMIVYRKTVTEQSDLRIQLVKSWKQCALVASEPKEYIATIDKPQDEISEPELTNSPDNIETETTSTDVDLVVQCKRTTKQEHEILTECQIQTNEKYAFCIKDNALNTLKGGVDSASAAADLYLDRCGIEKDHNMKSCEIVAPTLRKSLVDICIATAESQ